MAEESKVRLVRCPKCESLIQELPQYSVYECGSCGAVLKAKSKHPVSNDIKDRSDGSPRTAKVVNISRRKERIFGEKNMNFENVSSRNDNDKRALLDDDKKVSEHRQNHNRAEKGVGGVDNHITSSKNPINYWDQSDDQDMNMNRSKSVNSSRDSKVEAHSPNIANFGRSLRLKGVDRDGFGGSYKRSLGTIYEQNRISPFHYPDEGPSNYRCSSVHGYPKPLKSSEYLDVPNGVQNYVKDRGQLLKKLHEVKEKKMAFTDPPIGKRSFAHNMSSRYPRVLELACMNQNSRYDGAHVQNLHGNYPALKHVHHQVPDYGDSLSPSMHRRVLRNPHQQRTYGYSSRQYVDFDEDTFASHRNQERTLYPYPLCSCLHCYEGASQVPYAGFSNRRPLKDPFISNFSHHVDSNTVGQHYHPRSAKFHGPDFQDPAAHIWPSDIDSDIDGFGRRYPRRVVLTCGNKRLCHPISRGAPFITCYKCRELLKLPRKFRKMMKNDQRVRCGACSTLIAFEMEKKSLIISVPGNPKRRSTEGEEKSSMLSNECRASSHECFDSGGTILTSSNAVNSGYDQTCSKEEESPDNVIDWRDSPNSSDLPISYDVSSKVLSLPSKEGLNNPSSNEAMRLHRNRNTTKPAHNEKVVQVKSASQVVSEKNAAAATREDVALKGYLSGSSSQNSLESSKEESQMKLHKGSKTFLVGLIKKSFRDFSRSNNNNIKTDPERPNVLVNGQPISDHAVRKAERQAGQIHPGNYWYDHRAGFWGVMGQPCSGIIPPFIKEFNYPMPENCAAGITGVFVNGRELHQKDLDILACKGLPTTRDKSYSVEFNGSVLDEGNGGQLFDLGKLAPTVEKEKCGFGMLAPAVVE